MPIPNGLYEKDLTFLFNTKNMDEANKKFKNITAEMSDIQCLDKLSNGRGVEAYNKLSQFRIQSKEYYSAFQFLNGKKKIDLGTKEGLNIHVNRNKNMYHKAPKDLKTMREFVKKGYFIEEGYSSCHNIPTDQDTSENRQKALKQMLYLVRHKLINQMNQFSKLMNISFRGTPGTSFEGCQFIYNGKTEKLVTDKVNRGNFDYGKFGTLSHYLFDVSPWITMGNGPIEEKAEDFIMSDSDEKKYLDTKTKISANINECQETLYSSYQELVNFLDEEYKSNKSIESLETITDGLDYLNNEKNKVAITRENYINNFITKNAYRLNDSCDKNYEDFFKLIQLDNKILEGCINFALNIDIIANYHIIKNPQADRNQFNSIVMKSLLFNEVPLKEDETVDVFVPLDCTVYINEVFKNRLQEALSKTGNTIEVNKIFNEAKDFITDKLNENLKKLNIDAEFRVITDNVNNEYDKIDYNLKLIHTITHTDCVICGKDNFQKGISEDEVNNSNLQILPEEATENLNTYHKPEYL